MSTRFVQIGEVSRTSSDANHFSILNGGVGGG